MRGRETGFVLSIENSILPKKKVINTFYWRNIDLTWGYWVF